MVFSVHLAGLIKKCRENANKKTVGKNSKCVGDRKPYVWSDWIDDSKKIKQMNIDPKKLRLIRENPTSTLIFLIGKG